VVNGGATVGAGEGVDVGATLGIGAGYMNGAAVGYRWDGYCPILAIA
jgi:hypothetical protein